VDNGHTAVKDRAQQSVPRLAVGRWHQTFGDRTTPVRLRRATIVAAVLIIGAAVFATAGAARGRAGTGRIAATEAPVVVAANDLYSALNDMDAQLANMLRSATPHHGKGIRTGHHRGP
jgi:hypothetical protein